MSAKSGRKPSSRNQQTNNRRDAAESNNNREESRFQTELEYFHKEKTRLDDVMKKELSKNEKPEKKEFFPYIYTSLEAYADLTPYSKALDAPFKTPRYEYRTRNTASGMKTPVTSHSMDVNLNYFEDKKVQRRERKHVLQDMQQQLQQTRGHQQQQQQKQDGGNRSTASTSRSTRTNAEQTQNGEKQQQQSAKRKPGSAAEPTDDVTANNGGGTTSRSSRSKEKKTGSGADSSNGETERFPLFPTVVAVPNELSGKKLNYSHVPRLRQELRNTYSMNANRKIDQQYRLTKHEFHLRQLDRVEDYHPVSWPTMRQTYFAYLQNNPGSARAVHECVKQLDDKVDENAQQQQQQQQQQSARKQPEPEGEKVEEEEEKDEENENEPQNRMEIIHEAKCKLNLIGGAQ